MSQLISDIYPFTLATGPTGPLGTGPTGPAGTNGTNGDTGFTGPTGATGPTGVAGTNGTNGTNGDTGATGPTGLTGPAGQSTSYHNYNSSTDTSTPTSNGQIRWDNATQASSSNIYISHINKDDIDIDVFLALLKINDTIIIQEAVNSSNYQKWTVSSSITINSGYVTVPVTLVTSTASFSNNANVILAIISSGDKGPTGSTGPIGTNGDTGATGPTGAAGTNGTNGTNGDTGATGPTGAAGTNGTNGTNGDTGATGPTGLAGASGDKYTTSSTTELTIGTGSKTFTVDSGLALSIGQTVIAAYDSSNKMEGTITSYSSSTLVVNMTSTTGSGTYSDWDISLSGAPGPKGDTGSTGPTGAVGTNGTNGTNGDTGATGPTGAAGTNGTNGTNGDTGATGPTGAAGTNGTNGTNGDTGATGPTGVTGATGPGVTNAAACFAWDSSLDNVSNNTDTTMPLPTTVFNTDTGTFDRDNNRIHIKAAGSYLITVFYQTYDAHSNCQFKIKLASSSTNSGALTLVTLIGRRNLNGQSGTESAEMGWSDSVIVNVASAGFYAIQLNPSINNPYPSTEDSTSPRVYITRLS